MDPLPRPGSFSGTAETARGFDGAFAGQARFSGCITFMSWPRDEVAALLPTELELPVPVVPTTDGHPVVILFGTQTQNAILRSRFAITMGPAYHEFGLAIPYVRHRRAPYLHTHMLRMYSSYFPAVWEGNQRYFSKGLARMAWHGQMFTMTGEDGTLLFHAAVEPAGSWASGRECALPNFPALKDAFGLPITGRRVDGTLVSSLFEWDFDEAVVRPADAYASIDAPLVEGLVWPHHHDVACGAFEVRDMMWRLSWPASCRF